MLLMLLVLVVLVLLVLYVVVGGDGVVGCDCVDVDDGIAVVVFVNVVGDDVVGGVGGVGVVGVIVVVGYVQDVDVVVVVILLLCGCCCICCFIVVDVHIYDDVGGADVVVVVDGYV